MPDAELSGRRERLAAAQAASAQRLATARSARRCRSTRPWRRRPPPAPCVTSARSARCPRTRRGAARSRPAVRRYGDAAGVAERRPATDTAVAAIVPVTVGSGVAFGYGRFSLWRAVLALVVALALQVGVNYANDYSDGVRGTDERRVGPVRLVAAGLARPRQVLAAALGCFAAACAAGFALRRRHLLVAAAARRRRGGRRLDLHRRQPPVRLPRPGRGGRVRLLRGRRRGRHRVRPDGLADLARAGRVGAGRPALVCPAGDQQPAGHPLRHGGQASAPWRFSSATTAPACCTAAAC